MKANSEKIKNEFFKTIYAHPLIGYDDLQKIISAHQQINFSKGTTLLSVGQTANAYYLVEKGLVRAFVTDINGDEITLLPTWGLQTPHSAASEKNYAPLNFLP